MRIMIVDDEPIARDIMETYISKVPTLRLAGSCSNAIEAFQMLNKQQIDIMLLDINMPEITGIEFLKTIKYPPKVIFTTAYAEYAIESYELDAVDYLLKPVPFDRFLKAINKATATINAPAKPAQAQEAPSAALASDKLMFVKSGGKLIKIDLSKLWFVEGLKDYIALWTEQGKIIVHSTMKHIEEHLDKHQNFARVHKSYIVNLDYIDEVDGNTIRIKTQSVMIGNTYRDDVYSILNRYKFL
ncbi:MAG: response regulator transcription factor [Sphingobacteriales bacterium]|nr:MAG: response regulator transcription factor [Sphingobacteriales bacterium]